MIYLSVYICKLTAYKLNNLKRDPLEIQHPKFVNRLGFIESVHER